MNWTKEQQAAIDARGESVLLAAAAGSGKTAVLVERIIKLITDKTKPIDVNRLLVLTFTRAAAREMKNKIAVAIEKELEKQPNNENLKRQRLLLGSANISTIDSFCQEMLKANIHLTDVPVDFAICSQNDYAIILMNCINEVLEEYYTQIEKLSSFKALASGYGGQKNDKALREYLKKLYEFVISMPNPVKWLNNSVEEYRKVYLSQSLYGTVWDKELEKIIRRSIGYIEELMDAELSFCEEYLDDFFTGEPHKYTVFFATENEYIGKVLAKVKKHLELEEDNKYDKISELLNSISYQKLVTVQTKNCPEMKPFNERAKIYRGAIKDEISNLQKIINMPESTMVERICINYPRIKTLKNIVIRIMRKFKREKLQKNFLDFSDMEHEMLNLVCDKNGALKETAYALKERYEEILIDEYQDTNYVQDAIFKAISRDGRNIFMVGDIKQSIYMFRNAVPQLFLEKYESYTPKDENPANDVDRGGRLICLNRNFRSRSEVIDTANFFFENLMSRQIGNVEYNENEKLIVGAEYPKCDEPTMDSELILIRNDKDSEEKIYAVEARAAALRVKKLVKNSVVTDKESGKLRKIEYRDITILARNANKLAEFYEEAFAREGIPIHTGVGKNYLASVEVQTVLSFLQVIDNPYQDIPLIAVMRSPIFAFTANELALIRSYKKQGYFYDALIECAKDNNNEKCEKIRSFLKELTLLRTKFEFADIHSIIWHIYYNYNYFSLVGVMEDSALKQDNLRLLYNMALDFENSRFEGLFGFMNYIDGLIENDREIASSTEKETNSNTVTFMSIHQSKGLEFPIVILGGISRGINFSDTSNAIIWNKELGISIDCYDEEINAIYPSVTTNILTVGMKNDVLSEEMRLLYVALTRAKEKLILIASDNAKSKRWQKAVFDRTGRLLTAHKLQSANMQDWILSAVYRHKDADIIREFGGIVEGVEDLTQNFNMHISECFEKNILDGCLEVCDMQIAEENLENTDMAEVEDINLSDNLVDDFRAECAEIKENLFKDYRYKVLGEISAKVSVTELKRMKNETFSERGDAASEDSELNLFDENSLISGNHDFKSDKNRRPISENFDRIDNFTFKSTSEISLTEKGTIVHFVMQHIDFAEADTAEKAASQIEKMVERGMLTTVQANTVDSAMIADFAGSDICKRMLNSENVKKEFKFYVPLSVSDIYDIEDTQIFDGQSVMVQGIVDCFFEEDDGIVIVDYKTDKVKDGFLERHSEKYKAQLNYYQSAVEKIFNTKVKEKHIYYLDCRKSIEIE